MKVSDFFIGGRQFFAFLVPGLLWVAGGIWLTVGDPLTWINSLSIGGTLILLLGSFLVGYLPPTALFGSFDPLHRRGLVAGKNPTLEDTLRDLEEMVDGIVKGDKQPLDYYSALTAQTEKRPRRRRGQFCKWVVMSRMEALVPDLAEREAEINLVASIRNPLFFLAAAIMIRQFVPAYEPPPEALNVCAALLLAVLAIIASGRLDHMRQREEEAWYRGFLSWFTLIAIEKRLGPSSPSSSSARPAQKDS